MPISGPEVWSMPTKWNIEAEYIQSCNCAWGCTCNSNALPTKATKIDFKFKGVDSSFAVEGIGEVQSEHIRNPVTGTPFEGYILLPDGINMRKSTVTNIRRWSLRDDAAGWDIAHENVAGFVTVQRYNEKGPIKTAA